jgi:rod shape-determining protein MreD
VGIVHAALAPVIVIGGVKPNLVLVAVVLVTTTFGFLPGITWAFVAGLTANLLVGDPLGSIPLAMLIVAAMVTGGARLFGRAVWVYPVAATFAGSIVADVVALSIETLVLDTPIASVPGDLVLAAATLNAAIAAILLYPVRTIARRYVLDEATAW